jgi:hypothetical protein
MIPDGGSPGAWAVYVRAGGSSGVLERYRQELGATVAREGGGADEEMFWRTIADWEQLWIRGKGSSAVLRLSVPASEVEEALESAATVAHRVGIQWAAQGRAVGSLIIGFTGSADLQQLAVAIEQFRRSLPSDSMAVVVNCPTALKSRVDVWGSTPTDLNAVRSVRVALDPKQILNRGRFLV